MCRTQTTSILQVNSLSHCDHRSLTCRPKTSTSPRLFPGIWCCHIPPSLQWFLITCSEMGVRRACNWPYGWRVPQLPTVLKTGWKKVLGKVEQRGFQYCCSGAALHCLVSSWRNFRGPASHRSDPDPAHPSTKSEVPHDSQEELEHRSCCSRVGLVHRQLECGGSACY